MAKRRRVQSDPSKIFQDPPTPITRAREEAYSAAEQAAISEEMEAEVQDGVDRLQAESDLLVVVAILAHKLGINAVEPQPDELMGIYSALRGINDGLNTDTVTVILKRAQMELLQRQVFGKE